MTALSLTAAHAHSGHLPPLDPNDPLSVDAHFCQDIVETALQALRDRDLGRAPRLLIEDDFRSRLRNELTRHVHAEPQIRSQKFAQSYARARCNEALLENRRNGPPP